MSQDIVRQNLQRGASLPAGVEDLWGQQSAMSPALPQQSAGGDVQPLKLVHRSLRGRYKLAVLLALAGAACGTALGWTSFEKTFRAKGFVRISPETIYSNSQKDVQSDYARFMGSEATTLRSDDIARRAMASGAWAKAVNGSAWSAAQFANCVQAHFDNSSYDIIVSFDHPSRDIAAAGMRATLAAYEDYRTSQQQERMDSSMEFIQTQRKNTLDTIDALKTKIAQVNRDQDKGDLNERRINKGKRLSDAENRLEDEKLLLDRMNQVKVSTAKNPAPIDDAVLAKRDPLFGRLLNERDRTAVALANLSQVQGLNSPPVAKLRSQVDAADAQIKSYREMLSKGSYGFVKYIDGREGGIEVTDFTIAQEADTVDLLSNQLKSLQGAVAVIDSAVYEIAEYNRQIDSKTKEFDEINRKLEIAQGKAQTVNAPFRTFPDPTIAIQEDKRPTMATFGFVVGAGLPLMGLILFGLLDRKYRYSDEATSGGTRGVPLLGILPNLPDRLSDPSQASVAAHCVHQIRTMLQLNCLDEGPSVLAVTSATSGDGKTSLSLALGLSFAAAGSRTLLIDTDLIGAGLSARLGIREPVGIGEAITTRDPMRFVRDTDVTDLSVLPVGSEGAQNASSFSPIAVRRLLVELRKHFDLILIDTGPVLGSIEATPVVAASDAVILTVARGQNRDLVEKAINHLRTVGARIAGVVFNRANARDFERSISGISLRSVSRASANTPTNGHTYGPTGKNQDRRLGPLVHSVRGTREDVA